MIKVQVIGFDQALASAVTGVIDLFAMAGVTWQRLHDKHPEPLFDVKLLSYDGASFQCINHITLTPQASCLTAQQADLLLVPTIGGDIQGVLENNTTLVKWLAQQHNKGVDIASNCTGTFMLAEAGILDNRNVTTHWGFEAPFRSRFPNVNLQTEHLIVQDNTIFSAGGGMAWFDLALLLIERYGGHDIAIKTAKAWVIDMMRSEQQAYASIQGKKYHNDKLILTVQSWLDGHFSEAINIATLAASFNLSSRTLVRRFKKATGMIPSQYLQMLRVEAAKKLLERQQFGISQVIQQVGYEDLSSFTRLFKKYTSLSPAQYRLKFARRPLVS